MDWIVSEEIEDEEKDLETEVKTSADAQIDIPTVQILNDSDTGTCPICREEFEQFFKQDSVDTPKVGAPPTEDDEGWHYRNAVRMEGIVYHPQCHQDQKKHLDRLDSSVMSEATETEDESEAEQTQIKSEVTEETSEVKMEVAEREDDQPNDVVMEDASEAEKLDPEAIVKEDGSSDSIGKYSTEER